MNTSFLLLAITVAAITSCSTAYKTGQTPDDVYYSPTRFVGDDNSSNDRDRDRNSNYYYNDDREIRMGINDRRWRNFDNDIYYNPYVYGYSNGYYYNPYYCPAPVYNPVIIVTPNPKVTTPRTINLGGYGNGYNNANTINTPKLGGYKAPVRNYNNSNKYNSRSNNDYNNSLESNRNYTPSSNSSNSNSSGNKSSSEPSRPARTGKGG